MDRKNLYINVFPVTWLHDSIIKIKAIGFTKIWQVKRKNWKGPFEINISQLIKKTSI